MLIYKILNTSHEPVEFIAQKNFVTFQPVLGKSILYFLFFFWCLCLYKISLFYSACIFISTVTPTQNFLGFHFGLFLDSSLIIKIAEIFNDLRQLYVFFVCLRKLEKLKNLLYSLFFTSPLFSFHIK